MDQCITGEVGMKRRAALVVEGGGMRGSYVAGVLSGIGGLEGGRLFARVYGVSAGAFSGSLFVTGQYDVMTHIWRDLLHDGRFLRWRNIALRRPIMDLDYLVNILREGDTKLDLDALRISPIEFYIGVTEYPGGDALCVDAKLVNIFDALRASSALRLLYPQAIHLDGRQCIDGTYSDALPVARAILDGFQNIVVVRSRPADATIVNQAWWWTWLEFPSSKHMRDKYPLRMEHYRKTLKIIASPPVGVRVWQIAPAWLDVQRCTTEQRLFSQAILQGEADAKQFFPKIAEEMLGSET